MKIIKSKIDKITFHIPENYDSIETWLESIIRVCYKSEDKIKIGSADKLLKRILNFDHLAMIEHAYITIKITTDRGVSHELIRHRLVNYAQESTRYVNYSKGKFNNEITFIQPVILVNEKAIKEWKIAMQNAENSYLKLIKFGTKPDFARSVLPISTKTEIIMTTNIREIKHIINLRCSNAAHPEIRFIFKEILKYLYNKIPIFFIEEYSRYIKEEKNNEIL